MIVDGNNSIENMKDGYYITNFANRVVSYENFGYNKVTICVYKGRYIVLRNNHIPRIHHPVAKSNYTEMSDEAHRQRNEINKRVQKSQNKKTSIKKTTEKSAPLSMILYDNVAFDHLCDLEDFVQGCHAPEPLVWQPFFTVSSIVYTIARAIITEYMKNGQIVISESREEIFSYTGAAIAQHQDDIMYYIWALAFGIAHTDRNNLTMKMRVIMEKYGITDSLSILSSEIKTFIPFGLIDSLDYVGEHILPEIPIEKRNRLMILIADFYSNPSETSAQNIVAIWRKITDRLQEAECSNEPLKDFIEFTFPNIDITHIGSNDSTTNSEYTSHLLFEDNSQLMNWQNATGNSGMPYVRAEKSSYPMISAIEVASHASKASAEATSRIKRTMTNQSNNQFARNRLMFFVPGAGKQEILYEDMKKLFKKTDEVQKRNDIISGSCEPNNRIEVLHHRMIFEKRYETVSMHEGFNIIELYCDPKNSTIGRKNISKTATGAFVQMYEKACKDRDNNYLLLIENVNYADTMQIFAPIMGILSRNPRTGASANRSKVAFLGPDGTPNRGKVCFLPANFYIWATVNTSELKRYPLPTSFTRQWNVEYFGVDVNEESIIRRGRFNIASSNGTRYETCWNAVRKSINDHLSRIGVKEEYLLGSFFVPKNILEEAEQDNETNANSVLLFIKNEVLMYLYSYVFEDHPQDCFVGMPPDLFVNRYSSIQEAFDKIGMGIFGKETEEECTKISEEELSSETTENADGRIQADIQEK